MKQFYEKNKKAFYIALGYTVLCFGFMLTHYAPNIDEETWLLNETHSIMWLLQNRYTVYLYDLVFTEHGRFVPFFTGAAAIGLWNLSGFLFAYAFFDFEEKDRLWLRTMLLCYYGSIPFCVGEAFSFSMLIIPESFGMVLTAAAFLLTIGKYRLKGGWNRGCIILLLVTALGSYQALIGVYVTAVAGWCLCRFLKDKEVKRELVQGILITLISVGLYYAINLIIGKCCGTAAYLSENYIGWTNGESVFFNLFMALANVGRVSLAIPVRDVTVYGGVTLRVVTLLFVLFSIATFFRTKGAAKKAGVLLLTLGLVMAPFALYIALGTYKTHGRMMIALSLSGMIQLLLVLNGIARNALEKAAAAALLGILLINASNMNRIYYYTYLTYQQDRTMACQIIQDLKRADCDYRNKAVVFIGKGVREDIGIETSCTLGASFFEWDGGNIRRMIDVIKLEGCVLHMPSEEQIREGLALSGQMREWPLEGSIAETDTCIVIYLSEPEEKWYQTNLGGMPEK